MTTAAEQAQVLLAVNRIFREAMACETEEKLGQACLVAAEELTQSLFGFICEVNADGRLDSIAISDSGWSACRMDSRPSHGRLPLGFTGRGIYARVIRDRQAFFTNAPSAQADSISVPEGHPPVTAFLGAPLFYDGALFGMVAVANRPGGYGEKERAALESLAPAIVHAITHRRAEQLQKHSEERYRSIVETAQEGILIGALDGRILLVNQKMADMLGYGRDELLGRVGADFLIEPNDAIVRRNRESLRSGAVLRQELRFRRKDGSVLWTLASVSPLRDDSGGHTSNLAMHTDITELKQTEEALFGALNRAVSLGRFPEENPNPVMRVSAEGTVLYRNPAALRAPGWACEVDGSPPETLLPLIGHALTHAEAARGEVPVDGRSYSVMVAPFSGERYVNIYGIDVTERVAAEQAVRDANAALETRVNERTAELGRAIERLEHEVAGRKAVEERVRAERQRLYEVLETLPVYVVLLAPDYTVPFANRFFRERFGESNGRRCFEYLFQRSEPCEVCETYKTLKTGAPQRWEWLGPDGRNYDIYDFPFKDADGATLIMEMGIDVTERKRAEAELTQHKEHLEQLVSERTAELVRAGNEWERTFDSVPDLIAIIDNEYRIKRVNRAMAERLGVSATGCAEMTCFSCVHGTGRPHAACPLALTLLDRREHTAEVHEDHLGGDFIVSTTPLLDESGQMVGSVHVARDITERKQAEAALQKAHDVLEQRVSERTEELLQVNRMLRMISDCNQALVRATTEEELVRDICQIIQRQGGCRMAWVGYAESDRARSVRPVACVGLEQGYLEQARISWADDASGRGPTGTCIRTAKVCLGRDFLSAPELAPWREMALSCGFRSSIALPLATGGRAFGALTLYAVEADAFGSEQVGLLSELADDLAFGIVARRAALERDHARQVAEERARQLAALATELGSVEQRERHRLARLLHDHLQQLLVGAKYNLATLEGKLTTKAKQEAARTVTAILDEAIVAAGTLTAELSPPALHEKGLAAGLEWLSRQMRQKYGLTVEVRASPRTEPDSEQVRYFLFEAARELLFNVIKHAKVVKAEVELARSGEGDVALVVSDKGVGFDPERLGSGERGSGGFGLFSIRERLSCLGGRMSVESRPRRGSRFTLVAPAHVMTAAGEGVSSAAKVQAPSPGASAGNGGTRGQGPRIRVLLADDHAVMRDGLARLLGEQPDIEVVGQAGDGQAAIEMARKLKPDVVLMDVTMPRVNGIEATARLVAEDQAVHVIGLSMHENASMGAAMRQAGAVDYLTKSGPPGQLIAAIRACVKDGSMRAGRQRAPGGTAAAARRAGNRPRAGSGSEPVARGHRRARKPSQRH